MKTIYRILGQTPAVATCCLILSQCAIPVQSADGTSDPGPGKAEPRPDEYDFTADIGPHHRIWRSTNWVRTAAGELVEKPSSYVAVATGMNYQEDGEWRETQELIEVAGNVAVARKGPHKVIFAANINTPGAVDLQTPEGKRLRSHVLGISYYDAVTGKSVLIGEVKDSGAELIPPNTLVYKDAFTGISADVRYTYFHHGLEQDILLTGRLAAPQDFGLNPDSTRLEVISEFLDPPAPEKHLARISGEDDPLRRAAMVDPDFNDETLDFGKMRIGFGTAFSAGAGDNRERSGVVPVGKSWRKLGNRDCLIEAVEYSAVRQQLEELPRAEAPKTERRAEVKRALPGRRTAQQSHVSITVASARYAPRALALDYLIASGGDEVTFYENTTYLVNGWVGIRKQAAFRSGTVIKGDQNSTSYISLQQGAKVVSPSGVGTAILTSKDDNSVGEILPGSTGNPTTGGQAMLQLSSAASGTLIENLQIRYASTAIYLYGPGCQYSVRNCGFKACTYGVCAWSCGSVYLNNMTICNVSSLYWGNVQVDGVTTDCTGGGGTLSLAEAVDNWAIPWSTAGAAAWTGTTNGSYFAGDCAKSGIILDSQNSYVETTVAGPVNLGFYWKVSSEAGYDFLRLYRDGIVQASLSGDVGWNQKILGIAAGNHTVRWEYVKDGSVSYGSDAGWLDAVQVVGHGNDMVATTVGNSSLYWGMGGDNTWWQDYTAAWLRSGGIGDNQSAYVEATATGPGTVSFLWKVSSQSGDYLKFKIDGQGYARITGEVAATPMRFHLGPGIHALRWEYQKNASGAAGDDCGYLTAVGYISDSDADGLPDAWEQQYFGNTAQSAAADLDGDGYSNLLEFQNGTNPLKFDKTYVELSKAGMTATSSSIVSGAPQNTIDSSLSTGLEISYWDTTRWLRIDLGAASEIGQVKYRPGEYASGGTFAGYEIYVTSNSSTNLSDWGTPVASGTWSWSNGLETKSVECTPRTGRYVIFRCTSIVGQVDNPVINEVWIYQTAVSPPTPADSDADGLPDYWEMFFFGNLSQNGTGDWDQDAVSNLQEFQNGTNPNVNTGFQLYTPLKN